MRLFLMITVAVLLWPAASSPAKPVRPAPPPPSRMDKEPNMRTHRFSLPGGGDIAVRAPDFAFALKPFTLHVDAPDGNWSITQGETSRPVPTGGEVEWRISGHAGTKLFSLTRDGETVGEWSIDLRAGTYFDVPGFEGILAGLRERTAMHRQEWTRGDRTFVMNHPWLRDNIHELKGYKHWDPDLDGFVDMFLELQHDEGFFHEIVGPAEHGHLPLVSDKHKRIEPEHDISFMRLEIEADIEYLMVEAAYSIWQATGDHDAMKARLPGLGRGIDYMMTHPTRWDEKHQLLKRVFTIDTWDFTYGIPDYRTNRRIEPHMPMAIMHGDNSGLYQACVQLAQMHDAAGNTADAETWREKAQAVRERTNALCWNGDFYTHQIHLQPIDTGVDEREILSLSNPYNINRGLPTPEMSRKIIDTYHARWKALQQQKNPRAFAEWFTIDPTYPEFCEYKPGEYVNGGIAPFVAGELAKAAFHHGREAYGADILRRMVAKIREDGRVAFLYSPSGEMMKGGPSGWGAAALISAMMEGLAGIVDEDVLYRRVTISPRFAAAGIDQANVGVRYGPSGAYVAMEFVHDRDARTIRILLSGVSEEVELRVLLPEDVRQATVESPANVSGRLESVDASSYLVFPLPGGLIDGVREIAIRYASGG